MLAFAVGSQQGALVALQMAVAALFGLALYRQIKHRLVRERPYISHASIRLGTAPLDRYSFPSGHTLHAVSFTYDRRGARAGTCVRAAAVFPARRGLARGAGPALPDRRCGRRLAGLVIASSTLLLVTV